MPVVEETREDKFHVEVIERFKLVRRGEDSATSTLYDSLHRDLFAHSSCPLVL